ncbi:MAG: GH92 family glycosyl hydrolase, partial [Bacteroidaceae bacterium]|nr:GH92 family glycosyl hydrolase [Bacteroidaceae bacterium]
LGIYSTFSHAEEEATAGYYAVRLADYDIRVELTATPRCGVQRYTYPLNGKERIVTLNLHRTMNWDATVDTDLRLADDGRSLTGHRHSTGWAPRQEVYFATRFSEPWARVEIDTLAARSGKGLVARFYFAPSTNRSNRSITVTTALSGTSTAGAQRNLAAEAPHDNFKVYRQAAKRMWNDHLRVLDARGKSVTDLRKFYTALYHAQLAPTIYSDVDGAYRGGDGQLHHTAGIHYSTFSLWDTFRASHPLFTVICPDRAADMVQSLLDFGRQAGRLPVWSMWACETDMMIGNPSIPVIADAVAKGIGQFDRTEALRLCRSTMLLDNYRSLDHYGRLGYVPLNVTDMGHDDWSLSRTLEYAFDDACVAQMAQQIEGRPDTLFLRRAQFYRNTFDPSRGFFVPRDTAGRFQPDFHPEAYTPHICESNAWHYLWSVQHDIDGLMQLLGGPDRMA